MDTVEEKPTTAAPATQPPTYQHQNLSTGFGLLGGLGAGGGGGLITSTQNSALQALAQQYTASQQLQQQQLGAKLYP
jgi:F0F1-type ATP synthase membrane subunit c/vacuolar-type H+-ATPase subunit K